LNNIYKYYRIMVSSRMLHRVALVRTDVSEKCSTTIIRVARICELGKTLAEYFFAACFGC
jgi:hypothetical protein